MTDEDWDRVRTDFCRLTARKGVVKMAADLPAAQTTVYRLLNGETQRPTKAMQAAIKRVVEDDRKETDQ